MAQRVGPIVAQRVGPIVAQRVGPSAAKRVGPIVTQRVGPIVAQRVGPIVAQRVGPSVAQRVGRGIAVLFHNRDTRSALHGTVQLYLYPPSSPHWACNGKTLPLPYVESNQTRASYRKI